MANLYLIKLTDGKKRHDFIKFMFDEVFPIEAIAKDEEVSRIGRIDGLSLFGGSNSDPSGAEFGPKGNQNKFLLVVDGLVSGVRSGTIDQIKAFGADVEEMGDFDNDFSWTRQDKQN